MNKNLIPKNIKTSRFQFWRGITWVDVFIVAFIIGILSLLIWGIPNLITGGKIVIALVVTALSVPLVFNWMPGIKGWYAVYLAFKHLFMHKKYQENTVNDTLALMPYEKLVGNVIQTRMLSKKYNWVVGFKLKGVNFYQFSLEKQLAIVDDLQQAFKSFDFPFQIMAINRPAEFKTQILHLNKVLEELKEKRKKNKISLKSYDAKRYQIYKQIEILKNDINGNDDILYNKQFYIYAIVNKKDNLDLTVNIVLNELARLGFDSYQLDRYELVNSLLWRINPTAEIISNDKIDEFENNISELLAPKKMKITAKALQIDDLYLSINTISDFPLWVRNTWGADIIRNEQVFLWNINHQSNARVRKNLLTATRNAKANWHGAKDEISKVELEYELESYINLMDSLYGNNEILKSLEVLAISYSPSIKELGKVKEHFFKSLKSMDFKEDWLLFRQKEAFLGLWPQHYRPINYTNSRLMPSYTLASAFPFISGGLNDEKGIMLGRDTNNESIIFDQFYKDTNRTSFSMFISGEPGKGKTATVSKLINYHASIGNKTVIIDVEREYRNICEYHSGQWINLSVDGINPLQIFNNELEDFSVEKSTASPLSNHLSIFIKWFKYLYPEISAKEERVLLKELQKTYKKFKLTNSTDYDTIKPSQFPIMSDLYKTIVKSWKDSKEDKILWDLKELIEYDFLDDGRYSKMFNRHTTVELSNDFIVLDIHSLYDEGVAEKLTAQLYLTLGIIKNLVKKNRYDKEERKLAIVVDEAHTCIDANNMAALDFMYQMVKRGRKYRTGLIISTQNWSDMTGKGNPEVLKKVSALLRDCQTKIILPMDPDDVAEAEETYATAGGFTDSLKSFITHAEQGDMVVFLTKNNFICLRRNITKDEFIAHNNSQFTLPAEIKTSRIRKKKEIKNEEPTIAGKEHMEYDESWFIDYDPTKRPNSLEKNE